MRRQFGNGVGVGGGGGGGGGGLVFPARYDLSVNGAHVDDVGSSGPVLVTGTQVNAAGAYNGAGVGNKAIIGFGGHPPLPVPALVSVEWEWQQLDGGAPFMPYANLVVSGLDVPLRIFAIDPAAPAPLNVGTLTVLGPGHFSFLHDARTNFVQVVQPNLPNTFSPPVPVAAGAGVDWHNLSFDWAAIVLAFPGAQLVDGSTLDGGMPKTTVTPQLIICSGDATNVRARSHRLLSVKLNGADA